MIKIIAFLGADGSGKSTLLRKLEADLKSNSIRVKVIHFKPALRGRKNDSVVLPYGKNPHNYFISFVKLFLWCCEYISYFFILYIINISKHLVIIFDRHLLDIKIDPLRYRVNKNVSRLPFFAFIHPKPNIIFYMDAEPYSINKRKAEVSLKETKQQVKRYRETLKNINYVVNINTEQEISKCYSVIIKTIKKKINIENIANT